MHKREENNDIQYLLNKIKKIKRNKILNKDKLAMVAEF